MATSPRGSMKAKEPVISLIRRMPVSGERTMAEKCPVMAIRARDVTYCGSISPAEAAAWPNTFPTREPSTSRGKKMPPGRPLPKQSASSASLAA